MELTHRYSKVAGYRESPYIYILYTKWRFKAGETIELSLITKEELGLQPQGIISEDGE